MFGIEAVESVSLICPEARNWRMKILYRIVGYEWGIFTQERTITFMQAILLSAIKEDTVTIRLSLDQLCRSPN
jgi:hypothetical protein